MLEGKLQLPMPRVNVCPLPVSGSVHSFQSGILPIEGFEGNIILPFECVHPPDSTCSFSLEIVIGKNAALNLTNSLFFGVKSSRVMFLGRR